MHAGSLIVYSEAISSTTRIAKGVNVQWFYSHLSEVKICDFDQHFLLVSHVLNFCPFCAKKVSFNS